MSDRVELYLSGLYAMIQKRWPGLMDKLKVAHTCEADETGRIEDCPFGGEGHDYLTDLTAVLDIEAGLADVLRRHREEPPFRCKHTLKECRDVWVSGSRCCFMCNGHDDE